jgi:MFS family permease
VCTFFLISGAIVGSWVARIPAVKESLELSEGSLGAVLFGMASGALFTMVSSGALVARFGSRRMTTASALVLCGLLPAIGLAPDLVSLGVCLILVGAAIGVLDLSMNAHAAVVEMRYRRPLMSSFHAMFSLGGMAGAAAGGLVAGAGVPPGPHFTGAAALSAAAALLASIGLLAEPGERQVDAPIVARPRGSLAPLGLIAFCVLLAEGAMADWSAVYLRSALAQSPGVAAAGFTAFSLAMAAGRLAGDVVALRLGSARVVRLGASLAGVGLAGALLAPSVLVAVAGFGLVGLGLATTFPLVLSAAGRTEIAPQATSLAAVAGSGYFGLLVGPATIGFVAELLGLRAALGLVVALCAVAAILAGHVGASAYARMPAS